MNVLTIILHWTTGAGVAKYDLHEAECCFISGSSSSHRSKPVLNVLFEQAIVPSRSRWRRVSSNIWFASNSLIFARNCVFSATNDSFFAWATAARFLCSSICLFIFLITFAIYSNVLFTSGGSIASLNCGLFQLVETKWDGKKQNITIRWQRFTLMARHAVAYVYWTHCLTFVVVDGWSRCQWEKRIEKYR